VAEKEERGGKKRRVFGGRKRLFLAKEWGAREWPAEEGNGLFNHGIHGN
jgi:hypothetical protein